MEMTPLIDCVFLLLIFFMLSSSFLTPSIQLTLPVASAEAKAEQPPVMVTLSGNGEIYVNREKANFDTLTSKLREALEDCDKKVVTIRGDKEMKYDYFVRALDAAKASGAVHVNIAHETP